MPPRCAARRPMVLAAVLLASLLAGSAAAAPPSAGAAQRGAHHLAQRQGADGSVPDGWRPDQVAESVVALAAAGNQPAALGRAVDHLRSTARDGASTGPWAGRIVAGLAAAGLDPRSFAGTDFVARTKSFHDPVTGGYDAPNLYSDFIAMAALRTVGEPLPDADLRRVRMNQCDDGGWAHREGCLGRPDTDTTAMAVMVLQSVAPDDTAVDAGRRWLLGAQNDTGCWGLERGQPDNANSCALAIAAIGGLGEDPLSDPWTQGARRPVQALVDLQLPSGGFRYLADQDEANDYATVQAVSALAGWSHATPGQQPLPSNPGAGDQPAARRRPAHEQPGAGVGQPSSADGRVPLDDQGEPVATSTTGGGPAVGHLDGSEAPDVGSLSAGGGRSGGGGLGGAPVAAGFLLAVSGTATSLAWRRGHLGGARR